MIQSTVTSALMKIFLTALIMMRMMIHVQFNVNHEKTCIQKKIL